MKSVSALAIVMALSMTAAVAKDLKQDKAPPAPAVKGQVMSDSDMDKVTAGHPGFQTGKGIGTAEANPGRGHAVGRPDFVPGAPGSGEMREPHKLLILP